MQYPWPRSRDPLLPITLLNRGRWTLLTCRLLYAIALDRETLSLQVHMNPPPSQAELARGLWKNQWCSQFEWLQFSADVGKVFCKICVGKGGRSVYAKEGLKNLKVSAFLDHSRSNEHRQLAWASNNGVKITEKAIVNSQRACDQALLTLFKATYFIGKQSLPYSKFPALCILLKSIAAPITATLYQDEKACVDLVCCISVVLQKKSYAEFVTPFLWHYGR